MMSSEREIETSEWEYNESIEAVLIRVPANAGPGSYLIVCVPIGESAVSVTRVQVPSGYYAGSTFMFYYVEDEGYEGLGVRRVVVPQTESSVARNLFPDDNDDDDEEAMRVYRRGLHDQTPEFKGSYIIPADPLPTTTNYNCLPLAECDLIPLAEAFYESELQSFTDLQITFGAKILASLDDDGEEVDVFREIDLSIQDATPISLL
jgi:hypothetical protein